MIIVDANFLIAVASPRTTEDDRSRIDLMLADAHRDKEVIGIPTPALAEFLVRANEATHAVFDTFKRRSTVKVLPFDDKAAYEFANFAARALASGNKRGPSKGDWQKVKFDHQIIAIARANNAAQIVTDDDGIAAASKYFLNLTVRKLSDLKLPDSAKQLSMEWDTPKA